MMRRIFNRAIGQVLRMSLRASDMLEILPRKFHLDPEHPKIVFSVSRMHSQQEPSLS